MTDDLDFFFRPSPYRLVRIRRAANWGYVVAVWGTTLDGRVIGAPRFTAWRPTSRMAARWGRRASTWLTDAERGRQHMR